MLILHLGLAAQDIEILFSTHIEDPVVPFENFGAAVRGSHAILHLVRGTKQLFAVIDWRSNSVYKIRANVS